MRLPLSRTKAGASFERSDNLFQRRTLTRKSARSTDLRTIPRALAIAIVYKHA